MKIFPTSNLREKPLKIEKLKSTSILQEKSFKKCYAFNFIWKNPLKFIELTFNFKGKSLYFLFKKKSPLKFFLKFTGKSLYKIFLKKNPCKIDSLFRKVVNFTKEIPLNFFRKKINSEIWPQKYPLGSTS